MNNVSFQKQADLASSFIGGGVGSLAGGGLGALTGAAIADMLGASRANKELGMQIGGGAGIVGGGILGAKTLGPLMEKSLTRQNLYEDDLMHAVDQVRDAMKAEGLDGTLDSNGYRREFEKRFNRAFQEPLSQEQKDFVRHYIGTKTASRRYSASQMLGFRSFI